MRTRLPQTISAFCGSFSSVCDIGQPTRHIAPNTPDIPPQLHSLISSVCLKSASREADFCSSCCDIIFSSVQNFLFHLLNPFSEPHHTVTAMEFPACFVSWRVRTFFLGFTIPGNSRVIVGETHQALAFKGKQFANCRFSGWRVRNSMHISGGLAYTSHLLQKPPFPIPRNVRRASL